jgi:AcrR family transcriptional regulator
VRPPPRALPACATRSGGEWSVGERSRRTILRAAANLATVDGLEGISIGKIGMSKSGLYAHFGSKEELQLATVDTAKEIFEAEVVAPVGTIGDPLEQVRALYEAFLTHIERRVFRAAASSRRLRPSSTPIPERFTTASPRFRTGGRGTSKRSWRRRGPRGRSGPTRIPSSSRSSWTRSC